MSTVGTKLRVGMPCCRKRQTSHSVILHGWHFCMCVWLICKQEGGIQEVVAIKVSSSKGTILEGKEGGKLHSEESENKACKTIG